MNENTKLFAFKVSKKAENQARAKVWKAREGLAIAGCSIASGTWPDPVLKFREFGSSDNGPEC